MLRLCLVLVALLSVCSGFPVVHDQSRGFGSAKHVIIFGCDGFGEYVF